MIEAPADTAAVEAPSSVQVVRAYHERSKHRWKAYAAGPEALDWDSQPAPFRRFAGAPSIALPRTADRDVVRSLRRVFSSLFEPWEPAAVSLGSIGALLGLSFGITAWKSLGPDRWAVRANPSSGNLHPVEAYLIVRGLPELAAGVYHYRAEDHALERRARFAPSEEPVPVAPVVCVALSTVVWREAWKYGERAFRYCQLDTGHAVAALHYAGAVLGWRLTEQPRIGTATLAQALGLDRSQDFPATRDPATECEEAESLLLLGYDDDRVPLSTIDARDLQRAAATAEWSGAASTIDANPMYRWPVLNDIAAVTRFTGAGPPGPLAARGADNALAAGDAEGTARDLPPAGPPGPRATLATTRSVAEVVLGRRSARRFDHRYRLEASDFFGILESAMNPAMGSRRAVGPTPRIDFVLFVHRVSQLDPGVYLLGGAGRGPAPLAERLAAHFELVPVRQAPSGLDLRLVASVEGRSFARLARSLHCHQDIASQACFALGMVAEFDAVVAEDPAAYRKLHREAGFLGHVLYLEAEARGLRGTGIGCFFDDAFHDLLKLPDTRFQALYHFAVGLPIEDPRIETTAAPWPDALAAGPAMDTT